MKLKTGDIIIYRKKFKMWVYSHQDEYTARLHFKLLNDDHAIMQLKEIPLPKYMLLDEAKEKYPEVLV